MKKIVNARPRARRDRGWSHSPAVRAAQALPLIGGNCQHRLKTEQVTG